MEKILSREYRLKATTSGDRDAIAAMAQFIVGMRANMLGLNRGDIMRQLKREYGLDMEAAVTELDKRRTRDPCKLTEI
jgi:hypothetical protein